MQGRPEWTADLRQEQNGNNFPHVTCREGYEFAKCTYDSFRLSRKFDFFQTVGQLSLVLSHCKLRVCLCNATVILDVSCLAQVMSELGQPKTALVVYAMI